MGREREKESKMANLNSLKHKDDSIESIKESLES